MKNLLLRLALLAAALVMLCTPPARAAEPDWPDHLVIGTASPGGTYYVYGEALAKILTRTLDLPVVRLATDGPVQNIELMEAGEARLGFVTVGVALQAWNGTGVWAGKTPARSMRTIFPMYDTPFQFLVLQDSGIRSVAEMSGKRVGVGPQGGTSAVYFPEFFRVLNVPVSLAYGEWAELAAQVHERKLDVLAVGAGMPFPSFVELEAKDKVRYVALTDKEIAALRSVREPRGDDGGARRRRGHRSRQHGSQFLPSSPSRRDPLLPANRTRRANGLTTSRQNA
jgi:uncharacterized protein